MTRLRLVALKWLLERALALALQLRGGAGVYARDGAEFERLASQLIDWSAWLAELRREEARLAR